MSMEHEPAPAPDGEDLARSARGLGPRRRLAARGASLLLLVALGCSHVVPRDAPLPRPAARRDTLGTKATEATGTAPRATQTVEKKAPVQEGPPRAPEPQSAAKRAGPAATATGAADATGAAGLGLSGVGASGGGLGMASGTHAAAGSVGLGSGYGRLGGAHATAGSAGYGSGRGRRAAAPLARPGPVALLPRPKDDAFDAESYAPVHENAFHLVKDAPLSTFSVDVDTASYSNMRRFVTDGQLPPADSIRVEEWVNYFGYDDPAPHGDEPVAVTTELTDCPWAPGHELLRVALATEPIAQAAVPPRNLVFLVDVSGSMQPANKLPLLKRGLAMLTRSLRPVDTVSIVVYAGASGLALPATSGAEQGKILGALDRLESGGSTNGADGIRLAYQMAEAHRKRAGINRVILATDGDFNVGTTSAGELERLITDERKSGVFLTVLGFGEGNVKDSTMEMLADKGNGNYAYVDSLAEARKVLVHEAGATLVTIAQDVKLQLEFNPTRVSSYRLVGYENRALADRDFNDDTKDAGEMGAGHHVTAFYEIVATGATPELAAEVDPLRYQTERARAVHAQSSELATVKIRYKAPGGSKSLLLSRTVQDRPVPLAAASENLRFGAAVAEYALALRGAPGLGSSHLASAHALASAAVGVDPGGERREFVALMTRAEQLTRR